MADEVQKYLDSGGVSHLYVIIKSVFSLVLTTIIVIMAQLWLIFCYYIHNIALVNISV